MRRLALLFLLLAAPALADRTITFSINGTTGWISGAAGLDSECSCEGGPFADCVNETTAIASEPGMYKLVVTTAELACTDETVVVVKSSSIPAGYPPVEIHIPTLDCGGGGGGGGTCANCDLIDNIYAAVSGGATITVGPPIVNGGLELRRGADYYYADGMAPVFRCSACSDLTGATVLLKLKTGGAGLTAAGVIDIAAGTEKVVHADVPGATTARLTSASQWTYEVWVTLPSGHTWPEWAGRLTVP